jgi:hypothetical protein
VINPGSGPGPDALPDANYTREIPKLASYDNVRLLGYVPTTWAKRNMSAVRRDIQTYAEWPTNSSNSKLAVRGIFFDETPQQYDADALSYLQDLTSFVKSLSGLGPDNFVCVTLLCLLLNILFLYFYFFYPSCNFYYHLVFMVTYMVASSSDILTLVYLVAPYCSPRPVDFPYLLYFTFLG